MQTFDQPFAPMFRSRPEPATLAALGLIAIVIVIASTQLVYVMASRNPTVFAARSQVQYQGSTWVETQSERIKSRTLLEPVALAHGIDIAEFESNWKAKQVPGTEILQFEYHDPDPDVALSVVQTVTARYLADAEATAAAPSSAVEAYRQLEAELVGELAAIEVQIALEESQSDPVGLTALYQEKASVRAALDSVRLAIVNVVLFDRADVVPVLVTDSFVLSHPVGPLPVRRSVFGFLGGSILALGVGFWGLRTASNRRIGPALWGPPSPASGV